MMKDDDDDRIMTSSVQIAQHLENRQNHITLRPIFLSCIGWTFLVAFWSYYTTFPGLISSSGIEPATRLLPHVAPSLHRNLLQTGRIDVDSFCELGAFVGMILACILASGWVQHGVLVLVLTSIYSLLTRAGGVFYSFQWDTLLLETGAVVALCYAPWTRLRPSLDGPSHAGIWPLRFLLFKLMFMSGVVKIQADCPTWVNLTALEYHFATQCLPGPLAWYAHQLHPFFLRLSVAATLWIEIPLAFLLLVPSTFIRRTAACWQIVLQVSIMLTGNYNFFNLLTVALCLPCMQRDDELPFAWSQYLTTSQLDNFQKTAFLVFSACSMQRMFDIRMVPPAETWWKDLHISLLLTKRDCEALSEWTIPVMVVMSMALVVWTYASRLSRSSGTQKALSFVHVIVCILVIGVMAIPMCSMTPVLGQNGFWGSTRLFTPLWMHFARPYRLANGYGLFRRMTGVGSAPRGIEGWAGQPPSVVERPEIVLEGVFEGSGGVAEEENWLELTFRWKPGDTRTMPRQVAPHQPRLDWQMWFAALGSAQQNLWFINLVRKLLDGCEPVNNLLEDDQLMGTRKLKKLRAKLYHYDFTRIDSEWNRGVPGAQITNITTSSGTWLTPDQYWTRKFARHYLGTIEAKDTNLAQHLANYGYESTCTKVEERCRATPNVWCDFSTLIRMSNLHLFPVALLLASMLARLFIKRRMDETL